MQNFKSLGFFFKVGYNLLPFFFFLNRKQAFFTHLIMLKQWVYDGNTVKDQSPRDVSGTFFQDKIDKNFENNNHNIYRWSGQRN